MGPRSELRSVFRGGLSRPRAAAAGSRASSDVLFLVAGVAKSYKHILHSLALSLTEEKHLVLTERMHSPAKIAMDSTFTCVGDAERGVHKYGHAQIGAVVHALSSVDHGVSQGRSAERDTGLPQRL